MLWIEATTGAWSWLSKWWRCWSVWWRDSSGKELRSMRCSVASCLAVALLVQFLLYVSYRRSIGCQQAALHGLRRSGESIWSSSMGCHLVGIAQLGIDEWLVRLVQSMYKDVRSRVRVGDGYSEEFGVGVGVHQGSVLSPLLFIIVLEALSREFRTGCPWELLYTDDLMISAESMEGLLVKV